MKGDFARVTFDPARHYSQVMQQQGRVTLEADWNEQAGIQLFLLRTMIADLVGPCWAPGDGFAVTPQQFVTDWQLEKGHFYVDGILCQNETMCTLGNQPYAPTPADAGGSGWSKPPATFAVWLDVWERHLSAIEAPEIADTALNGVDTASRAQTVWQARLLDLTPATLAATLDAVTAALKVQLQNASAADQDTINQQLGEVAQLHDTIAAGQLPTGNNACPPLRQVLNSRATYAWPRLSARLGPIAADDEPCVIAADARFRGCENQLYRVEIHQGGAAGTLDSPSGTNFKWSRENGSVIFPIVDAHPTPQNDGSTQLAVTLAALGRDQRLGLAVNDWVELVDDDYTLQQLSAPLLQVMAIDTAQMVVTLLVPKNVTPYPVSHAPRKHPLLRRWDQSAGLDAQGCVPLVEGETIDLEDGVQITFQPGGLYANGDYWVVPARVAGNGTLDWPQAPDGGPAAVPSSGMHHQAVLGTFGAQGAYDECCCRFDSLCSLIRRNNTDSRSVNNPDVQPPAPVAKPVAKKAAVARGKKAGG